MTKKEKNLSNEYLSDFCLELSMLLHSGIGIDDGVHLLMKQNKQEDPVLKKISPVLDEGRPLSSALTGCGMFPEYMVNAISSGEKTGRLEESLSSLSAYYDKQERLSRHIAAAMFYPFILMVIMLVIVAVILIKVLPVFNSVFNQLGSEMTGLAGALLSFGYFLSSILPVLFVILAVVIILAVTLFLSHNAREKIAAGYKKKHSKNGIVKKIALARFSSALSAGMSSGLNIEDAMSMASSFTNDTPFVKEAVEKCSAKIDEGSSLWEALEQSGLFSPAYCNIIALGIKSGSGDKAMAEIARRMQTDADESIEKAVGMAEPAMIIITSIIVGIIILAVMLPLMSIMSAIG